ncbi:anti-sigma factor domain-containing protein [Amycolatopsis sp. VS8301801F10]|uniref:anti-sigma factor n=1 Tax=Amycolatopsis sp. VS8301801F10 TaxID=2652442 RepID=UPI0038FC6CD9
MSSADIHLLIGAYVLDAVTGAERVRFERHLRDCEVCAVETAELREVATRLGAAVDVRPEPGGRADVLARIAVIRQDPPAVAEPPAERRWRVRAAVVFAAAAAVAGALAGGIALGERNAGRRPDVAEGVQLRHAPDAATLTGRAATAGSASVTISRSLAEVSVSLSGMPVLDARHAYQVWLIGPRGPQSAGLLRPGTGPASLAGVLPPDADRIGITTEPVTGSPQPTTPGVVRVDLR